MVCYGIGSEDLRKLWSGVEPKPTDATAVLLAENTPKICLKLDRVFSGNGALYPFGLGDILTSITFPKAENVMIAATGSNIEGYTIEKLSLRYETISCMSLKPEDIAANGPNLAAQAMAMYQGGKQLFYDQPVLQRTINWPKNTDNSIGIRVNAPIKMLNSIVVLFRDPDSNDSENFENAGIESIMVSVEGSQNQLYSRGLLAQDLHSDARRIFGKSDCNDEMTREKFYTNAYCLPLDFRTLGQENIVASGLKLVGTQLGIKIHISKKQTAKDLVAHTTPFQMHRLL